MQNIKVVSKENKKQLWDLTCAGLPRPGLAILDFMEMLISLFPPFNICPSFWSTQTACRKTNLKGSSPSFQEVQDRVLSHLQRAGGTAHLPFLWHPSIVVALVPLSCCLGPCLVAPPVGQLGNCERQLCLVSLGQVPLSLAGVRTA